MKLHMASFFIKVSGKDSKRERRKSEYGCNIKNF
jgi:hypothetical protein